MKIRDSGMPDPQTWESFFEPSTILGRLAFSSDLSPRALQVLKSHLELRTAYVAAGKINHDRLFFLEDGSAISDPEVTRWRWNESLQKLGIRQRGPYHARHSSVTLQLMLGKNLLWAAKQYGHSVEVMLRMYAAWIEGQPRPIFKRSEMPWRLDRKCTCSFRSGELAGRRAPNRAPPPGVPEFCQ